MSTALYSGRFEKKEGCTVQFRLTITHPDESSFGTDRVFAWKLLSDWVSPPDDGDARTQAERHVRRVELSPLEGAKVAERGKNWFSVKRVARKQPSVVYTIEVKDPALLDDIKVGDEDEVYQYVEDGPALANEEPVAPGARRFEFAEGTSNKFWEASVAGKKLTVRFGKVGAKGTTQVKPFASAAVAEKELSKLVAEKLKKGYREVGAAGPAAPQPASMKSSEKVAGKAGKAKPVVIEPKSLDDFRAETFTLLGESPHSTWQEFMVRFIVRWASEADDATVTAWVNALPAPEQGFTSQAAGLVAVERARAGQRASAASFLALGEAALPTDDYGGLRASEGLVPAWFRLGHTAKATAALAAARALMDKQQTIHNQKIHALVSMAAVGGALAELKALTPEAFKEGDYRDDLIVPGCVALFEDGHQAALDELLERWAPHESYGDHELSTRLLDSALRRGEPERYLELLLRFPKLLGSWPAPTVALSRVEQKDAKLARSWALAVLDSDELASLRSRAVAMLAVHAPAEASAWAKKHLEELKGMDLYTSLAALGRIDEARGALEAMKTADRSAAWSLEELASLTLDRQLARDALELCVARTQREDPRASVLVKLVDLGAQAFVDAELERRLAEIEKLPAKDRDLRCRSLARCAGAVGRADLGLQAWKLPTNSVRYCTANDLTQGAAEVGDWSGAFAAMQKVPSGDANGRVSTAHQAGLRQGLDAVIHGPRAVPMRCIAWAGGSQSES